MFMLCWCVCSLPRHKQSGTIKGFSFVEFATVKEATTALEVHVHVCVIPCVCLCQPKHACTQVHV